jgi:tight adherence protein B
MPAGTARWVGFGAFVLGIAVAAFAIVNDPQGLPRRYWARYLAHIAKQQRRLFIFTPPQRIAYGQLAGIFACGAAGLLDLLPLWYVFAIGVAVLPAAVLENMRKKRVEQIEDQIDGFILALANALKATPSLGDGFKSVAVVVPNPIRQEIELAIKEMRVGATLDQALLMMASRVGSRQLDTALSSVLIGRQVGGNLPKILDSTAMSLREMKRLEGVVRTKTAEGKMQLWVLAVFPLFLIGSIESLSPGYFAPLTDSFSGYVVTFIASLFWIASLIVARKVLSVDI